MRIAVLSTLALLTACGGMTSGGGELSSLPDSVGYVLGYQTGRGLKEQAIDANPEALLRGLRDALGEKPGVLTDEQAEAVWRGVQRRAAEGQRTRDSVTAATNGAEGAKFMAANGKNAGVTTTASGLQWKEIRAGKGAHPTLGSEVTVHYRGTLLDGKEFDSSYGRDPVSFPLQGVIPGWQEGLQLMTAGSKYQFWIPPELAYGPRGSRQIGPNSTLVFEVELLSFK